MVSLDVEELAGCIKNRNFGRCEFCPSCFIITIRQTDRQFNSIQFYCKIGM